MGKERSSDRDIFFRGLIDDMVDLSLGERETNDPENDLVLAERKRILEAKLGTLTESEREVLEEAQKQELDRWDAERDRTHEANGRISQESDESTSAEMQSFLDAAWRSAQRQFGKELRQVKPGDHFPDYAEGGGPFGGDTHTIQRENNPFDSSRKATIQPEGKSPPELKSVINETVIKEREEQ